MLIALIISVASALDYKEQLASNTTCVCTTVPCPVAGYNYLTVGKGVFKFKSFVFLPVPKVGVVKELIII
jgi:hypothetical protein